MQQPKDVAITVPIPFGTLGIDWLRFAEKFDAIIIAPACKSRQTLGHWYCEWNVASRCVWNRAKEKLD
jgi:hypothetical protein